jgi:predicted DsbA family dithiol-disulfide isomerase
VIEVFADVSCPFAHVGLRRVVAERDRRGRAGPLLRVRAWPLELVNGAPMTGEALQPKVDALRSSVAPDLFAGFAPERFPATTLPVLAAEAAAHRAGPAVGERFSLAVRTALFEQGQDPSEPGVLGALLAEHGLDPSAVDPSAVLADWQEGRRRGVIGSPHFFDGDRGWFCPSLAIRHDDEGYDIRVDAEGLARFLAAVLGSTPPVS